MFDTNENMYGDDWMGYGRPGPFGPWGLGMNNFRPYPNNFNYGGYFGPYYPGIPNQGWGGFNFMPSAYTEYTEVETLDDEDITENVIDNLATDWMISRRDFDNIKVETQDGIVTLSGEVRDRRTKHHAYSLAYWTPGVFDVINKLRVKNERRRKINQPITEEKPNEVKPDFGAGTFGSDRYQRYEQS